MPCPRCGSHDLWDDYMWWGCNDCPFSTNGTIRNVLHPQDQFNSRPAVLPVNGAPVVEVSPQDNKES